MSRHESPNQPESRKAVARRRKHALRQIKKLYRSGAIDYWERDRLYGELSRRYAG